jgi:pilus assembly protein CpaF
MIVPRLHLAEFPEGDEDDRPIVRLLRKQLRERLAQMDAESDRDIDLENEARVRLLAHEIVDAHQRLALTTTNTPRLVDPEAAERELVADQLGAGPLQTYLDDPNVEEIGVNAVDRIWLWTVDGQKVLVQEPLFESDDEVVELVRRMIRRLQRQFNIAAPIVDAALPSGARLNAVMGGISLLGTTVTIRKFPRRYRHLAEIVRTGALSWPCAKFLLTCVAARANILIAGGMGTGKSTLMDVLLCDGITSPLERIVLIAETHDLSAEQVLPDCVVLQARPANADHQGEIKQSELFRTSLRMRATRVCVEEVRGSEAWQMLRSFASGHPGGLCTIHAETPRQALATLGLYAAEAENNLTPQHVAEWIANSLHLIVQLGFDPSRQGQRTVESVAEIDGLEGSTPRLQEIWRRDQSGELNWTGVVPKLAQRFTHYNVAYAFPTSAEEEA